MGFNRGYPQTAQLGLKVLIVSAHTFTLGEGYRETFTSCNFDTIEHIFFGCDILELIRSQDVSAGMFFE